MRHVVLLCCAAALVGCAKSKEQPAAEAAAAAAPAAISLADVAGKWTVRVMPETGDSVLLTYELGATADTSGWTFTFPTRRPIAMRVVAVAGDSIVTEAGPFESALRRGIQVTTRTVARLQNGKLVGTTVAQYASGPDPVRHLRYEGTRAP